MVCSARESCLHHHVVRAAGQWGCCEDYQCSFQAEAQRGARAVDSSIR